MAGPTGAHLWRLCLQRPLVLVIIVALVTCFIFMVLQNIAASDNPDEGSHALGLARLEGQQEANIELRRGETNQKQPGPLLISDQNNLRNNLINNQDELDELLLRIDDLKRIKLSVSDELRSLQREKSKLLKEKNYLVVKSEKVLAQINKSKLVLKQFELDISADKRQRAERQTCASLGPAPIVFNPLESTDLRGHSYPAYQIINANSSTRSIQDLAKYELDFSPCKLTQHFKFTVIQINGEHSPMAQTSVDGNDQHLAELLRLHGHHTSDASNACLIVILSRQSNELMEHNNIAARNALVINLSNEPIDLVAHGQLMSKSMVASSSFTRGSFRDRIDIVIPSILQPASSYSSIVGAIPVQSPVDRKYLAAYFGFEPVEVAIPQAQPGASSIQNHTDALKPLERILQTIHRNSYDDMFLFIYKCGPLENRQCFNEREKMLEMCTFLIVIPNTNHYDIEHNSNDLIYLALARGAIPVIVGKERIRLPFDEVLDWRRASVIIPTARLPELHFILRSLNAADIYSLKYHGRRLFEGHLASSKQALDSLISLISLERLNFPPAPIEAIKTDTYFPSEALRLDTNCSLAACREAKSDTMFNLLSSETFGPRETPFGSPTFRRNFSLALSNSYALWNDPLLSPHHLYPSNPNDPIPPSEFKFLAGAAGSAGAGNNLGYRPIGDGQGGSGAEFSQAIGGDHQNEQFTIVILTFERVNLLMKTLERLRGLAYLNRILVVWNGIQQPPEASLMWPDVGVPIVLVKVDRNSLNNRFLPYDAIETDAIFSMDDDSPLRPDEIVFAFRVWRESRDRIVGFPGRFHAWDASQNSWMYNSNHSCELSMVLTGGAFFHRYYAHVYSQLMPESIRSIVDKFMNCEDIAMNFLVAHLTRKPPIKVTSRWTFHCANCPTSLSEDGTHFMERHECLNNFASIYGYMPLLNTQHRSDSILFKTRLPRDKQKCFKFV